MNFDWHDYIHLADRLSSEDSESSKRTAISRAYYGAFIIARNKIGLEYLSSGEVHWRVRLEYEKRDIAISNSLRILRRLRNKADYENTIDDIDRDTHKSISIAKQMLARIDGIKNV